MNGEVEELNQPNYKLMLKALIRLVENCEALEKQKLLQKEREQKSNLKTEE